MSDNSYIGIPPTERPSSYFRQSYLATEGQTVFTGMVYQPGFIDVWHNGTKLMPATEFTASDGSTFTLINACSLNDDVQAIAFGSYNIPGSYTQAESDARYMPISTQTGLQVQQTLTDAATIAWNAANGTYGIVTITANRAVGLPTNLVTGRMYAIEVIQGTGGNFQLTWNAIFKFPGGVVPDLTPTVGARDKFWFYYNGTTLDLSGEAYNLS